MRAVRQPEHAAPPNDPDKDGSDGSFWCINGGIVGGTADACTCTCKDGWEGLSCEIAKACTASDDRQRTGAMACSTAQNNTAAPSAEHQQSARAHVPKDGWEAAVRLPTRAPPLWTQVRMEATAVSIAENTAPSVASPTRARVHATLGGMEAAARPQRRAQPPPNRQRMEVTASSTAQHNTAPSAEQPAIARVHAKAATGGAAVRLPARAAPLQT